MNESFTADPPSWGECDLPKKQEYNSGHDKTVQLTPSESPLRRPPTRVRVLTLLAHLLAFCFCSQHENALDQSNFEYMGWTNDGGDDRVASRDAGFGKGSTNAGSRSGMCVSPKGV